MSDSNHRGKNILRGIRSRAEPWWRKLVALGRAHDDTKKVIGLISTIVVLGSLATTHVLNKTVGPDAPKRDAAVPKAEPKQEARPKSQPEPPALAPVVPEKAKPPCTSISFAKVRQLLSDESAAPANHRRELRGREHCGWTLTVADKPYQHTNGYWRVGFKPRDGLTVVAEMRLAPWLQAGDIVLVGGIFGDFNSGSSPEILLRMAWLQKR